MTNRTPAVQELFAKTATENADKTAVKCDGQILTYAELDTRSNQLAHRLRSLGVAPGELVGICVERSLEMMVGLLATLKAGGAYVPIDPAYPSDRVNYMLEDSAARFVLTQRPLQASLPPNDAAVICLDSDWDSIADEPTGPLPVLSGPDDLAYVIYTSGSTGRPKGVEIPHRALSNFLDSMRHEPGLSQDDHLLAVTTLSFDIAGLELYLPLLVGARLVIASRSTAADGVQLVRMIEAEKITVMQATPATWRLLLESEWKGHPGLRILCGGEALPRGLADRLLPRCSELWNLYGPTETTIWSTLHRVEPGEGPVPIGHPIANTEVQLLDDNFEPVPVGEAGELLIGGEGLARGYYQRPELTAERFIPHPVHPAGTARLYRTGDLAKLDEDGSLVHLGRIDFQVKVRGFRIELGEIESVLDRHDSVRQSVVLAREDVPGDKRLVAYYVGAPDSRPSSKELRAALSSTLPDYMVPGLYVALEAFPLTPNGKVDRNALPAPDPQRPELANDYVGAQSEDEHRLATIWAEVLRVDKVGIDDDFFEMGGDSLKVAQVATRIREAFGVDLMLRCFFDQPTVAGIVPIILSSDRAADGLEELPIAEVTRPEQIPLSFSQERVWFLHQLNPENLAYNFHSTVEFSGELDKDALQRSLGEILRRHESYRTSFPTVDGRPVQIVHPAFDYELPVVDLRDRPLEERADALKAWCDREFQKRFDLAQIPLVCWTLVLIGDNESVLVHSEHHLVHDGWSFNMFFKELVELYRAYHAGEPSPLDDIPVQFAEFATWQHQWMQGKVSDHQLAYWKKRFETIPPLLELPTRGARPPAQTFRGASLRPEIPLALVNDLRALGLKEGSTLFMTMLAGFIALLHRYTSEPDIAVGTFFANRRFRESEHLIGMILNNVVIRATLDTNPSVRELMTQVRNLVLESAAYQDVPFDRVVEAVHPKRDLSMNPLFQIMFSFHDEPMPEEGLSGLDVHLTPVISNGSAKFDLGVIGIPHSAQNLGLLQGSDADGLTMIWEHNTDLFETETIARMIEHYKALLGSMVSDPQRRVSELAISTATEQERITVEWNETDAAYSTDECLHSLVSARAKATPDAVAVVHGNVELTYAELDRRSAQLAAYLRERGAGPDVLIGICVERSERMLVGLLGILRSGSAYVPIDPAFPLDRQNFMVEDAGLTVLVTENDLHRDLSVEDVTIVRLDADAQAIAADQPTVAGGPDVGPDNLAYVIYTSGSTGRPKGVQIPHRALVNLLESMREQPGMTADDRLLAVTTLSFDIAGLELYLPLITGGCTIICPRDVAVNGEELAAQMKATGATIMQATPTTWQMLIDAGWRGDKGLKALCGGEALPRGLAEQLRPLVSVLWNMYGPTETTIWSATHLVESTGGSVPIGRPIHNTRMYVLDKYDNAVPAGVVGELCIGGEGVARGYLNRPELTAERFIDNPIPGHGERIYRTGDLARYRLDGTLECLGRTDHQVKLRGFRIELGEIESQLERLDHVGQAVAIVREDVPGDARLVAYVVPAGHEEISAGALTSELKSSLPDYMVPHTFVTLDEMPLTPNGKVNRAGLPAPSGGRQDDSKRFVAPRNDLEVELQQIWEELLGVSPLGMHDDFFEVGGHSLLAVRLVSQIEVKTGMRLTLAALLQAKTIENVARILSGHEDAQSETGFVTVQTADDRLPFFAGGSSPKYSRVARKLGQDQPFYRLDLYGLQSQRMAQGLKPFRRIEEYAEYFIGEMKKVQPSGPYYIGGGCEGAYATFEMALQLQRQGEEIASLVLWIPPPLRNAIGFTMRRSTPVIIARQMAQFLTDGVLKNPSWAAVRVLLKHEYVEYMITSSMRRYVPSAHFDGEVTIIRTLESPFDDSVDLDKPWADRSTNGADVHVIPGGHNDFFDEYLDDFAGAIRSALRKEMVAGKTA